MLSNNSYSDSQNSAQNHDAAEEFIEESIIYENVQYLDETPKEYVEHLDEQTGIHEDFDDVSMDETSRETLDRTSRESTQSPVINDVDLIFWVEQFRHLYDKKEKDYKNKNVVENSWLFIGNKLKASSSECRDRWIALWNRFSKERCKLIRSGSGASDQKEWPLMKNLAFLHECVKRRKRFGNVKSSCKDRTSRESTQLPAVKRSRSRSTTPNDKGFSKASVQAKMDEVVDIFKKFVTERNTLTAEDNSLKNFCNSIYADLKNLDNLENLEN